MPRPGPRPYECVRRAWHSDRHQPIRGSLIQQIFRVVNEAHSVSTKKNKEWQEKLPVVVLKAEGIMYSKANSEAEYTNLDTLWDRVNDAINTIIGREETTETGDLLPPCIEAALNLGCIPIRASRSQRHANTRSYLTPRPPQDPQTARVPDITGDDRRPPPLFPSTQLNFSPRTTQNFHPVPNNQAAAAGNQNHNFASPPTDVISNNALPSQGSVYPLYYGTQFQTGDYRSSHHRGAETERSGTIYVGTPVIPSQASVVVEARPREVECDLSLRLGTLSNKASPSGSVELGQSANREFCFFPGMSADKPFEPSSRGKGPLSRGNFEDGKFCWQPGHPSNWYNR